MKNLMKLSVVLVAAALAFSSCNCFKKMAKNRDDIKLTVTPEILTLNNGTVAADINVTFPVEYFNKKAIIKVTPVIVFEGGEVAGATQYYQGSKVDENYAVVDMSNGGNYTHTVTCAPSAASRTPSACPTGPKPVSRMALFQSVRVRSAIRMPMQPSAVGMALQRISSSRAK